MPSTALEGARLALAEWSQDRTGCPLGGRGTLSGPVWGAEGLLAGGRRLTSFLEKA